MGAGSSIPNSRTDIIDQSCLAEKLSKKKPLVLVFVSPNCSLCTSIAPKITDVGATQQITGPHSIAHPRPPSSQLLHTSLLTLQTTYNKNCTDVAFINAADHSNWAPEVGIHPLTNPYHTLVFHLSLPSLLLLTPPTPHPPISLGYSYCITT